MLRANQNVSSVVTWGAIDPIAICSLCNDRRQKLLKLTQEQNDSAQNLLEPTKLNLNSTKELLTLAKEQYNYYRKLQETAKAKYNRAQKTLETTKPNQSLAQGLLTPTQNKYVLLKKFWQLTKFVTEHLDRLNQSLPQCQLV